MVQINVMNNIKILSAIFFVVLIQFDLFSQNVSFIGFNSRDGLPSSEVYDITQDDFGYIWFSTDKGISRYNGYEFENFDETDGLPQHVVFDFVKDNKGNIWCSTLSGELFTIKGALPQFTFYKHNDLILKYSKNHIVNSLYISDNDDVLLSFMSSFGLLLIDKNGNCITKPVINEDISFNLRFGKAMFKSILDDKKESFYYSELNYQNFKAPSNIKAQVTKNVVFTQDSRFSKTESFIFQKSNVTVFLDLDSIWINQNGKIIELKNKSNMIASGKFDANHFWVGHNNGGVYIYNFHGKIVNHFLKTESVSQLFKDRGNNYWISTLNNGVFLINNINLQFITVEDKQRLRINSLEVIDNKLFIGTYDGDIYKLKNSSQIEKYYTSITRREATIYKSKISGNTYFASDNFASGRIISGNVKFIEENGVKLVYGIAKLYIEDLKTKKIDEFSLPARTLCAKYVGNKLYLGTTKGLYVFKNGHFQEIPKFKNIRINVIQYKNNKIVLGTNGDGVYILNNKHEIRGHFTSKSGLSSNFVSNILIENDHAIWCCTSAGLNRINYQLNVTNLVDQFNLSGDLISDEIWDLEIFNDTLWIGAQSGLAYIAKKDIELDHLAKNNFSLKFIKLLVNEQMTNFLCSSQFNANQNEIEFNYTGISFRKWPKLKYRYKLVGADHEWKYTFLRGIKYSSLAPNKYEFIVQASDGYSPWHLNEIRYKFEILPPFYKTWWFILGTIALVIFLIYLFFKYRILSYNRYIVQEILRLVLKKIRKKKAFVHFKHLGKDVKIESDKIHFIKSDGNYLEIHTENKVYLYRSSFENFISSLPDSIEYLRIHRSYLVRIDAIQEKSKKQLIVLNQEIPVGRKYWNVIESI